MKKLVSFPAPPSVRSCCLNFAILLLVAFSAASLFCLPGTASSAPARVCAPATAPDFASAFPGGTCPQFAPGVPGKKGPKFADEKHSFRPKFLLPPEGVMGVTGIPVRPDTTHLKVLAIRVGFPETRFTNQKPWLDRHMFFASQYYHECSGGLLQMQTFVSDTVFTMPKSMAHYGQDDDLGFRLVELAVDAVAACDSAIDFTQYDEIYLIHAGFGQESDVYGDSPQNIWSASLGPSEFEYYHPDTTGAGHVGIATNDTLPDGKTRYIQQLVVAPEDEEPYVINLPNGASLVIQFSTLGVYVHEFGHLLGLPDLYDTEDGTASQGIGNWGLMGTGLWNANGYFPAEPEAWTKAVMGWKSLRVESHPGDIVAPYSEGANSSGDIVLVPLGGREYFLVENRLKDPNGNGMVDFDDVGSDRVFIPYIDSYAGAEFDFYLPQACDTCAAGAGLLIWHVDEQQVEARSPYNKVNADRYHKGVDLEEADGIQDLDAPVSSEESYGSRYDGFFEGNNTSFTPDTNPNSDGSYGGKSYVYIENIGRVAQLMSFSVDFGHRDGSWPLVAQSRFGSNHSNVADLNDDGVPEVIACDEGGHLYVLTGNAMTYPPMGAPMKALGDSVFSSPAVGDIDGDGLKELVVVTTHGTVFAWNGEDMSEVRDGDSNPATDGVLTRVRNVGRTEVVLVDSDGAGVDDIVFGASAPNQQIIPWPPEASQDSSGESVVVGDAVSGTAQLEPAPPVYPHYTIRVLPDSVDVSTIYFPAPVGGASAVADFDGDGEIEVLIPMGTGDGSGRLQDGKGSVECFGQAPPVCHCIKCQVGGLEAEVAELVAGDINNDGRLDIVASDVAGYIHALDMSPATGEVHELPGWPVQVADSVVAGISLGEIDGDGRLEVLATCDGRAFAINYNGTLLPGWPPEFAMRPYGFGAAHGPLSADVSGDGAAEYVGTICDSRLLAIGGDGRTLPDWPIVAGSFYGTSPALADIDYDDLTELVVVRDVGVNDSLQGEIEAIDLGVEPNPQAAWWPSYRRDPAHTGVVPDSVALPAPAAGRLVRKIYAMPNPVKGETAELHYELAPGVDRVRLKIYDLSGRLVHSASPAVFESSDNVYRLDAGALAPAVYLFSVEAAGNGATEKAFARMAIIR